MLNESVKTVSMKNLFLTSILLFLFTGLSCAEDMVPGVYRIASYFTPRSSKLLSVNNSDGLGDVIIWTNTKANAQYWKITKDEDTGFYYITNMFTGKVLYMNTATGKVTQEFANTRRQARWEILPVSGLASCYYITSESMLSGDNKLFLEAAAATEGAAVSMQLKSTASSNPQIWKIEAVDEIPNTFTSDVRDDIMSRWKSKYYKDNIDDSSFRARLDKGGWWSDAEMFEIILDAYETTGSFQYKEMFKKLHTDFIARQGSTWGYHEYNDDMAWMIIVCARAYLLFGENAYLQQATTNFNIMYTRALYPNGLLRWKERDENTKTGTNSCINGPAEVACCYLAIATGDNSYYEKAKSLYTLQRQHLVELPFSGKIYDSITFINGTGTEIALDDKGNKRINYWSSTYNQGTYLGAALMLYSHYGDEQYKEDAIKIIDWTKKNLCNSAGIFNGECGKQVDASGDLPGFKGIFMRYARRCIVDLGKPEYVDWLQSNVIRAYNNRNSVGVIWTAWQEKTTEDFKFGEFGYNSGQGAAPFGPSTAVSLAFNTPLDKNLIIKDAFAKIEAENFNYLKGIETNSLSEDETPIVTNIKDGYWTGYHQVNFGSQTAQSVEFRALKVAAAGQIEIRLGSHTGTLIGTADIPGGENEWETVRCNIQPVGGKQAVYLVFKGSGDLFRLNYFRFGQFGAGSNKINSDKVIIPSEIVTDSFQIMSSQRGQIYLYSIDGKLVHTQPLGPGDTTIDMKSLKRGLYIIRVDCSGNTVSQKIIKS